MVYSWDTTSGVYLHLRVWHHVQSVGFVIAVTQSWVHASICQIEPVTIVLPMIHLCPFYGCLWSFMAFVLSPTCRNRRKPRPSSSDGPPPEPSEVR